MMSLLDAVVERLSLLPLAHSETIPPEPPRRTAHDCEAPDGQPVNLFVRRGEGWYVTFEGQCSWLRPQTGLTYLSIMLAGTGTLISQGELLEKAGTSLPTRPKADRDHESTSGGVPAQEMVDRQTLKEVCEELKTLRRLSNAAPPPDEAVALDKEIAELERYLKKVTTSRGTIRRIKNPEDPTNAIGNAIRRAITSLKDAGLPRLAEHLTASISPFSKSLGYFPADGSIVWQTSHSTTSSRG